MTRPTQQDIERKSAQNKQAWAGNTHVAQPAKETLQQAPSVPNRQINVMLPYPPSVNHYWLLNRNGSRRISQDGVRYRSDVWTKCNRMPQIKGEVEISVSANPPDKRRRDLDNILKSLLDAIQHAGLIEDDSNIVDLHIVRREVIKGGAVNVEIRPA